MMTRGGGRARHARVHPSLLAWLAALALLLVTASASAAAASEPLHVAALGVDEPEALVVAFVLNREPKGQFFVSAWKGELLIRVEDLRAMGIANPRGTVRKVAGEDMMALGSIEGVRADFDAAKLEVSLTVDPNLMPSNTVDFSGGRKQKVFYPTNPSAFFNYDLGYAGGNAGVANTYAATTEFGARAGDFLLLNESTYYGGSDQHRYVRLMTSLIHDNRDTLVRTTVGDFFVTAGDLSSNVNMGGLSYSKLYSMDPYFVSYPQQSLTGMLTTASDVDVYIDGQKVRTLHLPAGPYDLRDITQAPGLRNVQLVVHDAFGREQTISAPFYSTQTPLKAGLQEFSYNVGALREMYGIKSDDYGPLAFAAFHRYGVTDSLTLGAHAEGKSGLYNAGATATAVLGAAGLLNVSAAASDNHGQSGAAALASYSYVGQHFNAAALVAKQTRNYVQLVSFGADARNYVASGTVGYTDTILGSISAGYSTATTYGGQDTRSASITYSRSFNGRASLFVTVMRTRAEQNDTNVFAGFVYNFDADYALLARYERFRGSSTEALQFQKAQPVGQGLGYTIAAQHTSSSGADISQFAPSLQYNGQWGILRGSATQQNDSSGNHTSYAASVAGGIAWAGGTFGVGRPVTDAFGLVKVDNLEGVRVRVNGEDIGKTDANGTLLIPTLASFTDNQVSLVPGSIPMDVSFPEVQRVVSPAYRGGAVIDFHAKRLHAFTGTLRISQGGSVRAAEFYEVVITSGGKPLRFQTGRGGEYYVEDLEPGRYPAVMTGNGQSCRFELEIPAAQEPFTELPDLTCEVDQMARVAR
jgi:outer membrane usher protein FimD/PapC